MNVCSIGALMAQQLEAPRDTMAQRGQFAASNKYFFHSSRVFLT